MENHISTTADTSPAATEQSPIKIRANMVKAICSFRGCMTADGHEVESSGKQFQTCCPFHQENTPSFKIEVNDRRAKCFGCDWSGDIIDYVRQFHSLDFNQAVEYIEEHGPWRSDNDSDADSDPDREVEGKTTEDTVKIQEDGERYAATIISDTNIAEKIVAGRAGNENRWKPDTITQLASENVLGWDGTRLVFIYDGGLKYRSWPGKEFWWRGSAASPWRSARLQAADVVYLTEGETDAISMIDAGFEVEPGVAVVAAPSATIFKIEWGPLFMGKKVIIAFDNDDAGKAGVDKVANMLADHAREVQVLDWANLNREVAP